MELKDIKISLEHIINNNKVDLWKSNPPKNPKFSIGQNIKIKVYPAFRMKDTGEKRDYMNAEIKKSRYSESLEDNLYEILIEESIQEFAEEKVLIDYIKE